MALQPNHLLIKGVRSAFLVLQEPQDYQDNKRFRWSTTALIPYGAPVLKEIEAKMRAVAEVKWGKKGAAIYESVISDKQTTCIIDGKKKPEYDGYESHWALTAHRPQKDGRPKVLDTDLTDIFDGKGEFHEGKAGRIYSGSFVNLKVGFWCQDNTNGKAIRAELITVQSLFRGDAFGGGSKPTSDEFEAVTDGADDDDLG